MEVSSNANISYTSVSLPHKINEILGLIVSLEWFFIVIAFLMFS